jgi:hypothetical protein
MTLASAAPAPAAWPPEHMKDLPADYLARLHTSLSAGAAKLDAHTFDRAKSEDSIHWARFGLDALVLGRRREEINRFFASEKFTWTANPKFGFSLFSTEFMRLYALGNHRTGLMKGLLSPAAEARIEQEMWRVAKANSKLIEAQRGIWDMEGSENHHITSKSCDLLAAQFLRHLPAYADQRYDDGSTLAEQYEVRRRHFLAWYDARARRGQFVEAASPSYHGWSMLGLYNLRDFAEDPGLRRKAELYLDLTYANLAEETLLTTRGGPKSRVKVGHEYDTAMSDGGYDLLFGAPGRTFAPVVDKVVRTSSYYPPPVVASLARDTRERGTYAFAKRWPGPVADGGGKRPPGESDRLWRTLDPERSVLRYGFATPHYVIGSAGVDPSWLDDGGMGFRWQGIVFAGDRLARIGFEAKPAREREWHGFNPFFTVQDRNVFVTQAWAPVPPNSPASRPAFLRLYFSPTLDAVQEEGGWIFVRDADAFAAIKVVAGGHTWSGVWRHSDAATFNAKGFLTPTDVDGSFLLLKSPTSPVITLASDAADYGHDFAAFKAAVQAQPVHWADGVLRFATITFYGPARAGEINGRPVNLAPARGYDSPFIRSAWNSGLIHLRHGNATALLDFRNPDNPVKTIGVAVTDAFPPGRGSDQPIRFSRN